MDSVTSQNTDFLLESILQNQDENTSETNDLLEKVLEVTVDNNHEDLLDKQLEIQADTLEAVQKMADSPIGIDIQVNGAEMVTFTGNDGKPGIQGEIGPEPSSERLMGLIQPLIPEPLQGKDADEDAIVIKVLEEITPMIPTPESIAKLVKAGKDGEKGAPGVGSDGKDGLNGKNGTPDTPKQVKEKLLKEGISYKDLKDVPDLDLIEQRIQKISSRTVSLQEIDNVDLSTATITNGKYVIGLPPLNAGKLYGRGFTETIQTSYEGSNDDLENNGTASTAGQSFQVPTNCAISSVSIYGSQGVPSSSGTFKIEIKTGSPTGTVIGTTGTLNSSNLSAYTGSPAWNLIVLTSIVNIVAGTTYYLVMTAITGSAGDEFRWSVDTTFPSYTGGTYYLGATATLGKDRNFRIQGDLMGIPQEISTDETLAMSGTTLSATGLFNSNVKLQTAGNGFYVKEGTDATMGTLTANGTTAVTVNTTKVTANSRIFITCQTPGGTPGGIAYVFTRTPGTSFQVKTSSAVDTSIFAWIIIEPA